MHPEYAQMHNVMIIARTGLALHSITHQLNSTSLYPPGTVRNASSSSTQSITVVSSVTKSSGATLTLVVEFWTTKIVPVTQIRTAAREADSEHQFTERVVTFLPCWRLLRGEREEMGKEKRERRTTGEGGRGEREEMRRRSDYSSSLTVSVMPAARCATDVVSPSITLQLRMAYVSLSLMMSSVE